MIRFSPEERRGDVDDLDPPEAERERVDDHADEGEEVDQERCQSAGNLTLQGDHTDDRTLAFVDFNWEVLSCVFTRWLMLIFKPF